MRRKSRWLAAAWPLLGPGIARCRPHAMQVDVTVIEALGAASKRRRGVRPGIMSEFSSGLGRNVGITSTGRVANPQLVIVRNVVIALVQTELEIGLRRRAHVHATVGDL